MANGKPVSSTRRRCLDLPLCQYRWILEVAVREPSPGLAHAPAVHGRIRFGRHEHDGVVTVCRDHRAGINGTGQSGRDRLARPDAPSRLDSGTS